MDKIIFLHGIKLVKFLVDCGLKVYFENKNYRVIKDRFDNYIIYCSKTEFSGGKIELYNNDFKEDKFFTLIQEIDSSLTKGKIIGLFHNEMYEEENLNEMNNNTLLEAVYSDEEYCTFYDCFDSFLSNLEFFEDEIINNEYCFRLIITDKDIAKLTPEELKKLKAQTVFLLVFELFIDGETHIITKVFSSIEKAHSDLFLSVLKQHKIFTKENGYVCDEDNLPIKYGDEAFYASYNTKDYYINAYIEEKEVF